MRQVPRVTGSVNAVAPLRPSKADFLAAIDELGLVTQSLADRFGCCTGSVHKWYLHFDMDPPYKYKLVADDIPLIRELQGCFNSVIVGDKFDVAPRTIRDVWNGISWRGV